MPGWVDCLFAEHLFLRKTQQVGCHWVGKQNAGIRIMYHYTYLHILYQGAVFVLAFEQQLFRLLSQNNGCYLIADISYSFQVIFCKLT